MNDTLALICDCDGVLINSEAIAGAVLVRELEARWPGVELHDVVTPLLGVQTERLLLEVASAVGRTLSTDDIAVIHRIVQQEAVTAPMVDGIAIALDNIPLTKACASNSTSTYVRAVLERTGLGAFFANRLFTADRVPNPKPAPDVYLMAAGRLGVRPESCLVVEDSVAGATAAMAAGMTVFGFTGTAHHPVAQGERLLRIGATRTFHTMSELPSLVQVWSAERHSRLSVEDARDRS
ncbi:HAD-IA family hydrolase [Paraburkholderia sp. J10-1]|uniref:HAD family hydrolase n=1 Tax=Paraburkholderia sp. J10-1 TaxID=2805430 RepID=UPI002AB73C77|nr:HAD-IA family hydrolase [Paraburkholderia sp. J10-1]